MAATYEPIASTTLGSAAADITFTSIPGTYTDLVLVVEGESTTTGTGAASIFCQVNGDTASNYSYTYLVGTGSSAVSGRGSSQSRNDHGNFPRAGSTGTKPGIAVLHFMSYANTNVYKTILGATLGDLYVERDVALWRSTSAITSIKFYLSSGNLASGAVAALYGIKAA